MEVVEAAMASPWVYLALFGLAMLDAFFPLAPSEGAVVTAGVFAADGEPTLGLVIAAAALGAFAGDHVSFFAGRALGGRFHERIRSRPRHRAAFRWAERTLADRGGLILVVCRYVPGARTAVTLTAGAVGYRRRSFSGMDAIAAGSWALYAASIGYLGGAAFEDDPLKGLMLGFALAAMVTMVVEVACRLSRRPRATTGRSR
jgi:membrane-associated protein